MRPQSQKYRGAQHEDESGHSPEVKRHCRVVPERDEVEKRFPVSLDNIKHGVELNKELDLLRHDPKLPEDRSGPEADLENNARDLSRVSHEDVY